MAVLQGYASAADGGGGIFVWSTTSATDDGGTVLNSGGLGSSIAGWRRIYSGPLSVKWFGAKGTGTDDTAAIKAAYAAAVALKSATVYFPSGQYWIYSTVTLGDAVNGNSTCINTIGEGALSTALVWKGPTSDPAPTDTMLRYWRNKYSRMSGLSITNGTGTTGTTIGTLLTGPASGTQSNNLVFENCIWSGFNTGLQAGGGALGTEAASEVAFINCNFVSCTDGFDGTGTGNTVNIWFYGCSFALNTRYGANLGTSSSVSFWGGGCGSNGVAAIAPNGGWQSTLRVEGVRFELLPPEMAIGGGALTLIVTNCILVTKTTVPTYPVIGAVDAAIIRGCSFGSFGDTGWLAYDSGHGNGSAMSLEMAGNVINGGTPFFIDPNNSGANGLVYSLFGNTYNGAMHGSEVGMVVWPNEVNDVVEGTATFGGSSTFNVHLTTRENANYTVTLSGGANQTFWVTNKSTTGFTLNSSVGNSTASVDWVVRR
jgi:hypothetical protein